MMPTVSKNASVRKLFPVLMGLLCSFVVPALAQDHVFRVTVISDLDEANALEYKAELEKLGFLPIKLDFVNNPVTVLYGEFETQELAIRSKDSLRAAGFTPGEVVSTPAEGAAAQAAQSGGAYRVRVDEVATEAEAADLQGRLEAAGFLFSEINNVGGKLQIIAGQYQDPNDARNLVALLKSQGFPNALLLTPDNTVATPTGSTQRPSSSRATPTPEPKVQNLSPVITQSSIWQELSEDQKRKVIDTVMMQDQLRSGDHVAQKIIDLERRIDDLDAKSKAVVKMIQDDREAEAQKNLEISRLYRDAQNLARGRQYDEALVKYRQILQIDPNHQLAATQIRVVEGFMRGERYDGQAEENQAKYVKLKAEAESLKAEGTLDALREARNRWVMIRAIDPEQYEEEADGKLNVINNQIATLEQEQQAVQAAKEKKDNFLLYGVSAFVIILVMVVATLSIFYVRRQRQQILSELRSITQSSVRPPRALEGMAAAGHLGSSVPIGGITSGDMGNTGLFGDDAAGAQPGDPLAQTAPPPPPRQAPPRPAAQPAPQPAEAKAAPAPQPKPQPRRPAPPPEPEPGPVTMAMNMGAEEPDLETVEASSADIDALFSIDETGGLEEPVVAAPSRPAAPAESKAAPQPAEDESSAFDDIFGDLPTVEETGAAEPARPSVAKPASRQPQPVGESTQGFSLDDVFADTGANPETAVTASNDGKGSRSSADTGISFDDIVAAGSAAGTANHRTPAEAAPQARRAPAPQDDPFADSPFADVLGGPPSAKARQAAEAAPASRAAEQDIPALPTHAPDEDPFSKLGGAETVESPAFAAPKGPKLAAGDAPTNIPPAAGGPQLILEQDFSADTPGSRPAAWEGDYDYASLLVRSDDPPRGARNYIAYEKTKGAGKVYYSSKFPNTSGVINVEFDLRCNNKNKFLLGFYIEKDEDFQQSVHTKILLSETQTAPTIHIHGEPAPYLLGSWAHIRYVIDLPKGLVNGYIDGTHIARDLRLPQAPKHLNTLAIRDNINTTGELLIANIRIEKIG